MVVPLCGSRRRLTVVAAILFLISGPSTRGGVFAQDFPSSPQNVRVYAGTATVPLATLRIAPSTTAILPGEMVQFVATVTGTSNTTVVWSATGGTITTTGAYTAGQTPGVHLVTATLMGGTIAGFVAVTIQAADGVVDLAPGQDIQAKIDALPGGTAFKLNSGLYRLAAPLRPKDGNVFTGDAGAILSGARLLSSFSRSGSYWLAGEQSQQGQVHGTCKPERPRCSYPEDLYLDDELLQHVATLPEVVQGKWYFDYANDRIYLADDPTGRRVETTATRHAFSGTAVGITISGLVIEKFANPAQSGAVDAELARGWTVKDNEIRFNHGIGVRIGEEMQLLRNHVHHNGQMGVGGVGTDVLVQGNEIDHNNTVGFELAWEAGGTKFVKTRNLIVRDNFSHHNDGPGLWTDIDNINTLYEDNRVEDNAMGIFHEISYGAVIRRNVVQRNGYDGLGWLWGAGITVAASPNVEVYDNTVVDNWHGIAAVQQARGSGAYGSYELENLWVHDNTVRMNRGMTGLAQDIGDTSYFTSRNNRFTNNSYSLGANPAPFAWMNQPMTAVSWQSYGHDLTGLFNR